MQAANVSLAWKKQLANGAPKPATFYSSPMTRSSDTLRITWESIFRVGARGGPVPVVVEVSERSHPGRVAGSLIRF